LLIFAPTKTAATVTGTFKANNPYNTFLLLIYGIVLKLPMFLHPVKPEPQQTDGFLFKQLLLQLNSVGSRLPAIYPLIAFILLYTQAVIFNQLANGQRLMQKPNYLTAMSYLLITSLFKEWNVLSAPLIICSLLVSVWARMSALNQAKRPGATLFNIGIIIGVATFFYFPAIAFAALIIFGLVLTRPFRLTEWVLSLLGIITPYYFLFCYIFLSDKWKGYKLPGIAISLPSFYDNTFALAAIIIVLVATVTGFFYIRQNFLRQLVQTRKSWNLVFLYFIVAVFIPFINATHNFAYWILCAVPLSAFVACAFLYPKAKWFPRLLHWIMLAFVIAVGYFVK
jgi:magnesium-transporting ATPase (P-type)